MSNTSMIVVYPRGQLSAKDKERLTKHGILAIEADDPSKVVTLLPMGSTLSADDVFLSAMKALGTGSYNTECLVAFSKEMCRRALSKEPTK